MSVERRIANLRSYVDQQIDGLRREVKHLTRIVDALGDKPPMPVREWTTAVAITIDASLLNMKHIVTNTAAHDFTLPEMSLVAFVVVVNDPTSTNDITVKDSGGTTVATLTPGDSGTYQKTSSNTVAPVL